MLAERFSSFPVSFPDETHFSVLSRYHLFYGTSSCGDTLLRLTGHRGAIPTNELPSGLRHLVAQLPSGHPATAEDLLERNTLWPYFRPFLDAQVAARVERGMLEDRSSHSSAQAGMLASRVGCAWVPKLCLACASEDQSRHGVPYWHRTHQFPGVLICHRHGTVLRSIKYDPTQPHRHALYLPPLLATQSDPLIPGPRQFLLAQSILTSISRLSSELLGACLPPLDPAAVQRAYRHGLAQRGLITERGHIRGAKLKAQFEPTRRLLSRLPEYQFLDHPDAYGWLARFVHDKSAFGHPLKHLVFIAWLYGSLDRFLESMHKPESPAARPQPTAARTPIDWTKVLPDLLEHKHLSMRKAAVLTGVCVNTVRTHAQQLGIAIRRCPKRITQQIDEEIARGLGNFVSPREIASRLGISVVSVYRYSRVHPELMEKRKDESAQRHLAAYRSRLVHAINENPDSHRLAIRRELPKEYAWLYRHDRDFLWSQFGRLHGVTRGPKERNSMWKERDRLAHHRIVRAAHALRGYDGKPIRLTVAALCRYAGVEKIVNKHLDQLPRTLSLLKASGETLTQFRKRRIVWAIEESIKSGIPVSIGQVARLAGISTEGGRRLQSYIQHSLSRGGGPPFRI